MDGMDWLDVSIETTRDGIDPVSARVIALDIEGLQIEDYQDFLEMLDETRKSWDYVDEELLKEKRGPTRVKVYLRNDDEGRAKLAELRESMRSLKDELSDVDLGTLDVSVGGLREEDWSTAWKQYYKPTPIGERLLILPEWEPRPQTDRVVFLNNPGMSFGTGTHASTRLALMSVEKLTEDGARVLDLGCGSGILAICALLLGASNAELVDIDPAAARIAIENAKLNGVDARCTAYAGDLLNDEPLRSKLLERGKYPLVLANIVADVIIPLCPFAAEAVADGGAFVTSGIIEPRLDDVLEALTAAGFTDNTVSTDEGWCSIISRKASKGEVKL